jgi:uncharacterized Zn-finger protein
MAFACPHPGCTKLFSRNNNLNRHYQNFHLNETVVEKCFLCHEKFANCDELQNHYINSHKKTKKFVVLESAFKKTIITYRYVFPENCKVLSLAQASIQNKI